MSNDFPKLDINTQELIDEIERLLKEASKTKSYFGAVNWGDLGVSDVEYRMSMLGSFGPYCVVVIDEASPECKLSNWIMEHLDRERFKHVYVECKW